MTARLSRSVDTAHSDAADEGSRLASAVRGARLCHRCTAIQSGISGERLGTVIQSVQRHLMLIEDVGNCESCERRTVVYRLC
jgi:hypothetical protein